MAHPGPGDQHRAAAPVRVRLALLTVSDTRTAATNDGGRLLRRLVEEAGLTVADEALLPDEPAALQARVAGWARDAVADAAVLTGGTGFSPRDQTPDAIAPLYDRRLPGFGELFRWLSFQEIGAAAMLSRAEAGVVGRMAVFLLPGSPAAIDLAMRKLIVPELPHLVGQLRAEGPIHRG
ncbi:MAG: molybdenum cofactor biosynthesis protein B [Polyangia bacterium]